MGHTAIVVGGGIGGLSVARALTRIGWHADVYERAAAIGPVGAGVGIAPNAVQAMNWLGLGDELRARAVRQDGLRILLRSGRRVVHLPGELIAQRYGEPYLALHRATLHEILRDSLDPAGLHTDHTAIGITSDSDAATVTFATPDGEQTVSADLVIAADGVRSGLRQALYPPYPGPSYAGYTVWRGVVPASASIDVPQVMSETWGPAARFGTVVVDGGRTYWFACESMTEHAEPNSSLKELADRFRGWHDPIPQLLDATPPDALLRNDVYYLRHPLRSFVDGRVALLGDAAHAVTPDIGQGACLALEDSVVLAHELSRGTVTQALAAYDRVRRPRTQPMVKSSGRLGRVLQWSNPIATGLRDGLASLVPTGTFLRFTGSAFAWTPPT